MLPVTKLISFLLPTRGRKALLFECLDSLISQIPIDKRKLVEVILRFDTDDLTVNEIIPALPHDKLDFQTIISYRGNGYKDGYIWCEECARLSRANYFVLWNDDAKFETNDWLNIFIERIKQEKSIYSYWFSGSLVHVENKATGEVSETEWPSVIFHHRKFWEILGFMSGKGGVDSFLSYVLDPLGLLKKIPEIKIQHIPWFQKPKETWDQTTKDISVPGQMVPTDFELVKRCQQKIVEFVKNNQKNATPSQA